MESTVKQAADGERRRNRKVGTLVSACIEQGAYEALVEHCARTGQSKTKAIERAILNYCTKDRPPGD